MFQRLNLAAGALHLSLFILIAVTNAVLKNQGRVPYKLRFTERVPTVPKPPKPCREKFWKKCPIKNCPSRRQSPFCDLLDKTGSNEQKYEAIQAALHQERKMFTLQLAYVVAAFPLITSAFHFAVASNQLNPTYTKFLGQGRNPFRWVEYSITASIMLVAIAGLSDITDFSSILGIFALMMGLNILGLAIEDAFTAKRYATAAIMFSTATLMFIVSFYAILSQFTKFVNFAKERAKDLTVFFRTFFPSLEPSSKDKREPFKLPSFVNLVVWGIFGLYFIFPILMLLRLYGKFDYVTGEKYFLISSLVVKAFLVIVVASGIIREDPPEYVSG